MKSKSQLVDVYKKMLTGNFQGWVLFEHGTCVVIPKASQSLRDDAIAVLGKHGQVIPGTPLGDFGLVELKDHLGWVVTGNHPDILNFVSPDEVQGKAEDAKIGLFGRSKRELDAKERVVIHIEEI